MNKNLSTHLSYKEAVRSNTAIRQGIDNNPTCDQLVVMKNLAENFFEKLRSEMSTDVSIKVNSFYRSKELNTLIGGSSRSDHMVASDVAAIDLDDTYSQKYGIYNRHIFLYILENMDYYKLIWEYEDDPTPEGKASPRWVHVSYSTDPKKNRKKITLFTKGNGYLTFNKNLI